MGYGKRTKYLAGTVFIRDQLWGGGGVVVVGVTLYKSSAESQKSVNAVSFWFSRTRRTLSLFVCSDSTLLVLNETSLNIINTLLALNWRNVYTGCAIDMGSIFSCFYIHWLQFCTILMGSKLPILPNFSDFGISKSCKFSLSLAKKQDMKW